MIMTFLKKLQNLPEAKKKIILWTSIIILAFFLVFFYYQNIRERLALFDSARIQQELEVPAFREEIEDLFQQGEERGVGIEEAKGLLKEILEEAEKQGEDIGPFREILEQVESQPEI